MKRQFSKESMNTSQESCNTSNMSTHNKSISKAFYVEENIKINDSSLKKSFGKVLEA
jgi:outer membrane receptor for ferrienterochelin and colicin